MARTTGRNVRLYSAAVPNTRPADYDAVEALAIDGNRVADVSAPSLPEPSPEQTDRRVIGEEDAISAALGFTRGPMTFTCAFDNEKAMHKTLEEASSGDTRAFIFNWTPPGTSAKKFAIYVEGQMQFGQIQINEADFTDLNASITATFIKTHYES